MIWTTMLATTAAPAPDGGCCLAAPGRTPRGARPSAAAAPRARPCTCPCRRACWSPRSTTRWRGAASAATASTCRDVPSRSRYMPRPAARVGGPGRTPGARGGGAERPWHRLTGHRAGLPTYVLVAVPGRAPSVDIHDSDRHGSDGLAFSRTWWATVAGAGAGPAPAACVAVDGAAVAAVHWTTGERTWCGRTGSLDWPDLPRGGGAGRGESTSSWHDFFSLTKLSA